MYFIFFTISLSAFELVFITNFVSSLGLRCIKEENIYIYKLFKSFGSRPSRGLPNESSVFYLRDKNNACTLTVGKEERQG